jgi:MYXO-CTERM domain-containing protein
VANYKNVTIPTNLDVKEEARERFGEFYAALFDRTIEKNPGAVVTEYAWDASSCDPCPTPALEPNELVTLGADVLHAAPVAKGKVGAAGRKMPAPPPPSPPPMGYESFVLTRLHARYSKDGISEDLVFKAAKSIAGGREWRGQDGKLEEGAIDAGMNNFQARYAIRHEWTGPIACASPTRGIWGGPPGGAEPSPSAATNLAFVERGKTQLAQIVRQDVPEIDVKADKTAQPAQPQQPAQPPPAGDTSFKPKKEKNGCAVGGGGSAWLAALALGFLVLRRRRRS